MLRYDRTLMPIVFQEKPHTAGIDPVCEVPGLSMIAERGMIGLKFDSLIETNLETSVEILSEVKEGWYARRNTL